MLTVIKTNETKRYGGWPFAYPSSGDQLASARRHGRRRHPARNVARIAGYVLQQVRSKTVNWLARKLVPRFPTASRLLALRLLRAHQRIRCLGRLAAASRHSLGRGAQGRASMPGASAAALDLWLALDARDLSPVRRVWPPRWPAWVREASMSCMVGARFRAPAPGPGSTVLSSARLARALLSSARGRRKTPG